MNDVALAKINLAGHSIVLCKEGKLLTSDGRGVSPMIDFLQDIAQTAFRHGKIGHIDVPAAIRLTGNRLRVQPEGAQYFKQVFVHFQSSSV